MKENGEGSKKTEEESGGGRVRYYVGILFVLAANVLTVVSNYFVKVREWLNCLFIFKILSNLKPLSKAFSHIF